MSYMENLGQRAKEAAKIVQYLGQDAKNAGLRSEFDLC